MTYDNKDYDIDITNKTLSAQQIWDIKQNFALLEMSETESKRRQMQDLAVWFAKVESEVDLFQSSASKRKRKRGLFLL